MFEFLGVGIIVVLLIVGIILSVMGILMPIFVFEIWRVLKKIDKRLEAISDFRGHSSGPPMSSRKRIDRLKEELNEENNRRIGGN